MKAYTKDYLSKNDLSYNPQVQPVIAEMNVPFGQFLRFTFKHFFYERKTRYIFTIVALVLIIAYGIAFGKWNPLLCYMIGYAISRFILIKNHKKLYDTLHREGICYQFDKRGVSLVVDDGSLTDSWDLVKKISVYSDGIVVDFHDESKLADIIYMVCDDADAKAENLLTYWHSSSIPTEETSIDEQGQKVVEILKEMGCEVTELGESYILYSDDITEQYLKESVLQKQRGYTNVLVKMNSIFVDDILEEYESHVGKDLSAYVQEKLSAPLVNAEKVLADRFAEAEETYKSDSDFDWETEIVGTRDEAFDMSSNEIWTGDDGTVVLSVNVPVEHAYDVFCYLPLGMVEGPSPEEHRAIAKYWYEKYGAEPCLLSGDELQYHLPKVIDREASEQLTVQQFAYCEDVFTQNDIKMKQHEQYLENSTFWFFWWD